MPRKLFKRVMLRPERLRSDRKFRWLGKTLAQPNLWHLSRTSVSRAFLIGMFWMIIPMPLQSIPAALCAISLRANVGIAVVLCWISNPLTMGPFLYGIYWLGSVALGRPTRIENFEASSQWLWAHAAEIGLPMYLGALICGVAMSISSYFAVRLIWRWHVLFRRSRRLARAACPG